MNSSGCTARAAMEDFAVLYRQHAHRDQLVEELSRRKNSFVISKLSIWSTRWCATSSLSSLDRAAL